MNVSNKFFIDFPQVAKSMTKGHTRHIQRAVTSSAVKTYNLPTHQGFCHNFPTKTWYYHTHKNWAKAQISKPRFNQVILIPFS